MLRSRRAPPMPRSGAPTSPIAASTTAPTPPRTTARSSRSRSRSADPAAAAAHRRRALAGATATKRPPRCRRSHPSPGAGLAAAYVASGENFPDALAGAPAADRRAAPILLVQAGVFPAATSAELTRLKPNVIYLLGGTAVVSTASNPSWRPSRAVAPSCDLAGTDRTRRRSRRHRRLPRESVRRHGRHRAGLRRCAGRRRRGLQGQHADPAGAVERHPGRDRRRSSLARARAGSGCSAGPASISTAVEAQLHGYAGTVTRLAGDDRYETAIHISKQFFNAASGDHLWVATGALFPDALSAGATGDPVLLTRQAHLPTGALPAHWKRSTPRSGVSTRASRTCWAAARSWSDACSTRSARFPDGRTPRRPRDTARRRARDVVLSSSPERRPPARRRPFAARTERRCRSSSPSPAPRVHRLTPRRGARRRRRIGCGRWSSTTRSARGAGSSDRCRRRCSTTSRSCSATSATRTPCASSCEGVEASTTSPR